MRQAPRRMKILILTAVIMLLSWSQATFAQLMLEEGGSVTPSGELIYLEDAGHQLDFEQARNLLPEQGRRWAARGQPTFGYTGSAYWLRIDLDNRLEQSGDWVVHVPFALLDRIDFFYQTEDEGWQQKSAGHALPFEARDLPFHLVNFLFPVQAGQAQTLYFRVENSGSLQIPLEFSPLEVHQVAMQRDLLVSGIYFGGLLIILFYSVFMWRSSGERGYLYFLLFIAFGGMYSFIAQGLAYQYLWPENPEWASYSLVLVTGLTCMSGILFAREFLAVRRMPTLLQALTVGLVTVFAVGTYASAFLPIGVAQRSMFVLSLLALVLITALNIKALRAGERSAMFFAAAWLLVMAGIVVEMLQHLGWGGIPLPGYRGIQIGTFLGALTLAFGLSDRVTQLMENYRAVQEEIIEANQRKLEALQRTDNIKEEFIANVSHELRTPLTGIIGLAEIMLEDRERRLSSSDRETLQLMKVSAQRLATLVNDVVDFSTLKKGKLDLRKQDVDLERVCSMVVRMTRPMLGGKPVVMEEQYPDQRLVVEADEDRLQQILFNLLSNAIKYTQIGSITLRLERRGEQASVCVIDTGVGIPEAEQERIFQRFYQVDSEDAPQSSGTGLGLSITRKLLELHGTDIDLSSKEGEGSEFCFVLPLKATLPVGTSSGREEVPVEWQGAPADEQDGGLSRILGSPPVERRDSDRRDRVLSDSMLNGQPIAGQGGSILVVDDEYLNLRIVESHLADDYQLRTASGGEEALRLLTEEKPDLMILDLMMPVMDGFELCQLIRRRYDMDEMPIIILTARNRVEDLVKGLSVGANDYITKPFSKEELRVRINKQFELLQLHQVRRENQRLSWQLQRNEVARERLKERETRLARMLDITGDALLCVDESGYLVYVNGPAEELFGVGAEKLQGDSINRLVERLSTVEPDSGPASLLRFPFNEQLISTVDDTRYHRYSLPVGATGTTVSGRFCILSVTVEQEFYLLVFETERAPANGELEQASLPELIAEINKNVERTQLLGEYLSRIEPGDLQKHKHLFSDLEQVDQVIQKLSGTVSDRDSDTEYREALVKVMQDCHFYWEKVTGKSVIDLAEESRIWSVSVDNGRLRTRSMNRYLALDKLPANPRWRQVARTAYFVLSKIASDREAYAALETSVTRLQDIVEQRALG